VPRLAERCATTPPVRGVREGRLEMRLSGSGGQGIILAATLVADAAAQAGRQVVKTQSYGPEARGGASKAEVIVDTEVIDFPEVETPDITLCLSQAAFEKYARQTRAGGLLLYDSGLVTMAGPVEGLQVLAIPFSEIAAKEVSTVLAANIVAVGALLALSGFSSLEMVEDAIKRRMPSKIVELNLRALELGRTRGAAAFEKEGRHSPIKADLEVGP
jgi:2-oxoglutarate ferredoxin oxidoreductase subunit gamma